MNNLEKQVILSGILGDGHITDTGIFCTGSKFKEYIDYKMEILKSYNIPSSYNYLKENGYSKTPYHRYSTKRSSDLLKFKNLTLFEVLNQLDDIGLALWFYDDGSLHKHKLFYNLNTHSFTEEEHIRFIIPALHSFGLRPTLTSEKKRDGRKFWYIRINKRDGAELVNKVLKSIPFKCFKYKTYSGNINDTLTRHYIHVVNTRSSMAILYDSIESASIYTGVSVYKIKKSLKKSSDVDGLMFSKFIYGVQRPVRST